MSTDLRFLMAAIAADPADDTARLIYADCLEEQGNAPRAEFIRLQIEAERLHPDSNARARLEEQAQTLFADHWINWWGEVCAGVGLPMPTREPSGLFGRLARRAGIVKPPGHPYEPLPFAVRSPPVWPYNPALAGWRHTTFHRGFPDSVRVSYLDMNPARNFLQRWPAHAPLSDLSVTAPYTEEWIDGPSLAGLRSLTLDDFDPVCLIGVLTSPNLGRLEELTLIVPVQGDLVIGSEVNDYDHPRSCGIADNRGGKWLIRPRTSIRMYENNGFSRQTALGRKMGVAGGVKKCEILVEVVVSRGQKRSFVGAFWSKPSAFWRILIESRHIQARKWSKAVVVEVNPGRWGGSPLRCPKQLGLLMLVPLSWLRDYVPLPADPATLIERLTIAGLEAAGVKVFGQPVPTGIRVKPDDAGLVWERDKVMVAQVLEITKHPNADTLKLVKLDYGAGEPKTVVTGATNIAPGQSGMKVVLGLRGSKYFTTDKKDGKKTIATLEPKALRGIDNDAMCMSNFELGISDEHEGIIILDDADPAPGTPLQDLLGEIVVELDILPNMARCLSMIGIAREVAALTGATATIAEPKVATTAEKVDGKVAVVIDDPKLCPRYTATIIRDVTVKPAPRWMQSRLQYAGMRPINNVVDITNYVMLEHGQPLHAFDYDVLLRRAKGNVPTIFIRPAKMGEKIKTLDGQDRELSNENLVIADTAGAIALAGVMGGLETEVTGATKTILLESAAFDFVSIRKTARQFNLFSEASTRFSRGIHPDLAKPAAVRAAELFRQHAGGDVLAGIIDNFPLPPASQVIELHRSEIARLLGFDVPPAEVERVLTALEFQVKPETFGWLVTAPRTRLDIQVGAADLIEELARVYGYDKLPERLLPLELPEPKGNRALELEDKVRDLLVDQGLQEAITYSMTSAEAETKLGGVVEHVALMNPISPERSILRRSLLPGLLAVVQKNLETADSVAMYELGFIYLPKADAKLPDEPRQLAVVICGRRTACAWDDPQGVKPAQADFFDMKGVVEALAADLHLPDVTFAAAESVAWLHPGRAAELKVHGKAVGVFGELHPKVAACFGLGERGVQVAEFDLEAILACVPERYAYRPFSNLPPAKRDVAVIVPSDTPAERVLSEIRTAGGELLTGAELFDLYRGEGIPAGTKSLAFALTYQSPDHTLSDKEITKAHEKVEGRLRHVLQAQIRGKDV